MTESQPQDTVTPAGAADAQSQLTPESQQVTRRNFAAMTAGAGAGVLAALAGVPAAGAATAAADEPQAHVPGPHQALRLLLAGNRRWARAMAIHPHQSVPWRLHVAAHQEPFATVISCIDSRVPPEIVFDRGLGDMFVVRTGAQALDELVVLGSAEFGPFFYPSARLMVVLGHEKCGAVTEAIKAIQSGSPAPGHIQAVVNALRPAYLAAKPLPGDLTDNTIRAQIRLTVRRLKHDPLLRDLIARNRLAIVGGYYHLRSGIVEITA